MIPLCNLHTHTTYCDGQNSPEDMILSAIRQGCHTLGFSGHAPADMWGSKEWTIPAEKMTAYRDELLALKEKYAPQIEVLVGLELDYYSPKPDWVEYTIGSVHQLKLDNGIEIPVDLDYHQVQDLVGKAYGGNFLAYARDFYALSADVANRTGCEIVGHFDLLTKFNEKYHFLDESDRRYQSMALEALDAVMEKDVLFEMNTGAISRGWRTTPYPAPFLVQRMAEKGARVILNSDSHAADTILFGFENAVEYARANGLHELWVYKNGQFVPFGI